MATPYIRPFRDVSEHFVLNLFSWSGAIPNVGVPRGTFVKIISGWQAGQNLKDGGPVGGYQPGAPSLPISRRYNTPSVVGAITASGDLPLGLTLYETRELDENQIPLIFNKSKQAQLQAVLSGESVPIATKGLFIYSGIASTGVIPANGGLAYLDNAGLLTPIGTAGVTPTVGAFLGPVDSHGWVLFKLDI